MAEWRLGRGWTEQELEERLALARGSKRNFTAPVEGMSVAHGWHEYYSEATLAYEEEGPPALDGPFSRGRQALVNYSFSDPRIVRAHFDPSDPLLDRFMLLEARAFRVLHYLGGVVVGAVREETGPDESVFGFRYETLEGHIEQGAEWFLLTKEHVSGRIRFRIQAAWRPGEFPNWWSRVGFALVGRRYQRIWHARAHRAMMRMIRDPSAPRLGQRRGRLRYGAPVIVFRRLEAEHV